MLICCVKTGTKYGARYVRRLHAGVMRNLHGEHKRHSFVCFTDDRAGLGGIDTLNTANLPADLPGWWAKIGLCMIEEPLLYFDLDMVITGDLTPALEWEGFGIIKDVFLPGYNSSVLRLTGK